MSTIEDVLVASTIEDVPRTFTLPGEGPQELTQPGLGLGLGWLESLPSSRQEEEVQWMSRAQRSRHNRRTLQEEETSSEIRKDWR